MITDEIDVQFLIDTEKFTVYIQKTEVGDHFIHCEMHQKTLSSYKELYSEVAPRVVAFLRYRAIQELYAAVAYSPVMEKFLCSLGFEDTGLAVETTGGNHPVYVWEAQWETQ